jgi:hypothetical protein
MTPVEPVPVAVRFLACAFTLPAGLPDEVLSVKIILAFAPARAARAGPGVPAVRSIKQLSFTLGAECEPVSESAEIFFRGFGVMRVNKANHKSRQGQPWVLTDMALGSPVHIASFKIVPAKLTSSKCPIEQTLKQT